MVVRVNDVELLRHDIINGGRVLPNQPGLMLPVLDRIEAELERLREDRDKFAHEITRQDIEIARLHRIEDGRCHCGHRMATCDKPALEEKPQ